MDWEVGMKITLTKTAQITTINGVEARIWEGATEKGVAITAFITRIVVLADADISQFEEELKEKDCPNSANAWPFRMLID